MAVVGLTSRNDAVELLEKRVRSRFSQRILPVPSLKSMADCQATLIATISLAPRAPLLASGHPLDEEEEEEREEERAATPATVEAAVRANQAAAAVEAAREAGELDEYAKAWAAQAG